MHEIVYKSIHRKSAAANEEKVEEWETQLKDYYGL